MNTDNDIESGTCRVHGRWHIQYFGGVPVKIFCNQPQGPTPNTNSNTKPISKQRSKGDDKDLSQIFRVRS